jgi:transcriptional regulator with PAS, ATPase and Fis domain
MDEREYELMMAAAGYKVKKRQRRKPKLEINITPELLHREKIRKLNETLDSVGGHRAKAAELLGITERTLYRWLREDKRGY